MQKLKTFLIILLLLLFPYSLFGAHGVSIDGKLKYQKGFSRFAYTASEAVNGGSLILHDLGGFDKMNPFTLKGSAPFGLDTLIFEPLAVSSLDEPLPPMA